ncbi:hypothetical protein M2284_005232 [Rhodococcus sp. LBL1]|nr:hypothetical protein [Rhodococcus sp. LBL1]MDH6686296.1 hypothetical protein [Rhodococcus sp. LBL2]
MTRSSLRSAVSRVMVGAVAVAAVGLGQALVGPGTASAADSSSQTVTTSNITATKTVTPAAALPGQTVEVKVRLDSSGSRYMREFTDYAPADYVLQSVSAHVWRSGPTFGDWNKGGQFDGTATQDASGAVKLNWLGGGDCVGAACKLVLVDKGADLTFTYKVRDDASIGARQAGMSFNIYAFSSEQTWKPLTGLNLSVAPFTTTTTVPTLAPITEGDTATLAATVSPASATGNVQFRDGGVNIGVPVPVSNGQASLPHAFDVVGNHDISAVFSGTGQYSSSTSGSTPLQVNELPTLGTTTTLQAPSSAVQGTTVTLTTWLDPAQATGTVQFKENGAPIGSPVAVDGGTAQLSYAFTQLGNRTITAEFTGGKGFGNSVSQARSIFVSAPVPQDVTTTTTLTAPATAQTGQQVTLTANLDPANAAGSVQFKDGNTNIGGPVAVSNGKAIAQATFTTAGQHSITAVFTGGTGFKSSTSAAQTVSVSNAVAQTTLTVSAPSAAQTGSAVTLSAAVNPANASGTVQFTDGGNNIGGPVQVTGGAASLQHTFTTGGAHTIGATFTAAAGFTDATASTKTIQVSVPTPEDTVTTTTATAPATATVGQSVKLSATVAGGQNLPGTVQFYDGDTPIGGNVALVNGVATLDHTFATEGAHLITARYSGGQGVKASVSPAQTVQVTAGGGTGSVGSLGTMFGSLGGR